MAEGGRKRLFWGALTVGLGILFMLDLVALDPIPLVDEVVTGLLTAASAVKTLQEFWKKARGDKGEKKEGG